MPCSEPLDVWAPPAPISRSSQDVRAAWDNSGNGGDVRKRHGAGHERRCDALRVRGFVRGVRWGLWGVKVESCASVSRVGANNGGRQACVLVVSSADWMKVVITGERFCGCICTAIWSSVCVCATRHGSLKRRCRLDKRTNPHPKGVGDSSRPVGSARQVGERGTPASC